MRYRDAKWQQAMKLTIDYTYMLAESIGSEHGLKLAEIEALAPKLKEIKEGFELRLRQGELEFVNLPYAVDEAQDILRFAASLREEFEQFVLVGIGGSSLGPQAICQALCHPYHNLLGKAARGGAMQMFFCDNIDPDEIAGLLEVVDPRQAVFNIVTKSGSTAETMGNFLVFREWLIEELGEEEHRRHIVVTTDPERGDLRRIAEEEGYRRFCIPPGVGGRFSVLSPVGLLPAACCGVDVLELLAGAAFMANLCHRAQVLENPAMLTSALQFLANTQKGKNISVLMPYSAKLGLLSAWFVQLWAESLGKRLDLDGRVVNVGPTPLAALGAKDQHSQLQLFIEGPYDKLIAFIRIERFFRDVPFPAALTEFSSLGYLGGKTLAELIQAEALSTSFVLAQKERPNYTIILPELNAFTLGELFFLLEMQTAYTGELYGINPYDQPGVEAGKQATYGLMGREGYAEQGAKIRAELARKRYLA